MEPSSSRVMRGIRASEADKATPRGSRGRAWSPHCTDTGREGNVCLASPRSLLKPLATWACHPRLLPIFQGGRGAPNPDTHLEAGDSKAASVIRQGGYRHHKRAVWDVLIIELDGDLVVTWGEKASQPRPQNLGRQGRNHPTPASSRDRLPGSGFSSGNTHTILGTWGGGRWGRGRGCKRRSSSVAPATSCLVGEQKPSLAGPHRGHPPGSWTT